MSIIFYYYKISILITLYIDNNPNQYPNQETLPPDQQLNNYNNADPEPGPSRQQSWQQPDSSPNADPDQRRRLNNIWDQNSKRKMRKF